MPRSSFPAAALALALTAAAAQAEPPLPLRQAALAVQLYQHGLAAGDALTVLAAARIHRASAAGAAAADPAWQAMLDSAEALAAGDTGLLALIADARAEGARGVASGPVYELASVPPAGETVVAELAFKGSAPAEVYVESAPGTDIDLRVTDASGTLVCADTHASHVAYCAWTPATDGVFTVTILNPGSAPADYALMTN
jgi:hypothetical protein